MASEKRGGVKDRVTTVNDNVNINLTGKNILVTGGSLGIGYAAAEACLAAQANVYICARDAKGVEDAVSSLGAKHGEKRVFGSRADVSNDADIEALLLGFEGRFGALDGVIHAAGIYGPIGAITDVEPAEWLDVLRINLFGSFLVTRSACRVMKKRGGGRIVLLSGGGAATPFPNYTGYACSKAGVARFAETAALEMEPFGISINCLAPGFVATRLHQQTLAAGRDAGDEFYEKTLALTKEGAVSPTIAGRAAAFFMSDAARGISGKFIAAPYDCWSEWPTHLDELSTSDVFTLRRILPKDRGSSWQ